MSAGQDDPVRKQLRDLKRLESALFSKEGRPDLFIPFDSLRSEIDRMETELGKELSLLEQYRIYSRFVSDIGCGHTQLHPNKKVYRSWLAEYNSIPIDYYLFGQKLVTNKLSAKEKEYLLKYQKHLKGSALLESGTEIIAINDKSTEEMMLEIGEFLSSDEDHVAFKYFQARHYFEFYRHLSNPFTEDSVRISYIKGKDTVTESLKVGRAPVETMNARMFSDQEARLEHESDMGEFRIIRNKYGYFRFKSFVASSGRDYANFLENAFRKMKEDEIDKVVVDLRGNTGGVMQYDLISYFIGSGTKLGSYVVSKPHKESSGKGIKKFNMMYLRHILLSKKQEQEIKSGVFDSGTIVSAIPDTSLQFKGEIVVITDEGTFSSAAILASHLKTLAEAKIIGRTAGGSFYGGNSGTLLVKLPNSKFTLLVNPNTFKSQLERGEDPTAIKLPDLELNPEYMADHKLDAYYFREATRTFD